MKLKQGILIVGGLFSVCALNSALAAIATTGSVFLRADPGNYLGYGLPLTGETLVHGVDAVFRSQVLYDKAAYIYLSGDSNWSFEFAAAQYSASDNQVMGRPLQVGYYANATRYPFNSPTRPEMDVSGNSRGYNQLSGWFNVLEATYTTTFEIASLAVDFAEYGENLTQSGPALFGSLRFNSAIPLTLSVPEPAAFLQLAGGLLIVVIGVTRKRKVAA